MLIFLLRQSTQRDNPTQRVYTATTALINTILFSRLSPLLAAHTLCPSSSFCPPFAYVGDSFCLEVDPSSDHYLSAFFMLEELRFL